MGVKVLPGLLRNPAEPVYREIMRNAPENDMMDQM